MAQPENAGGGLDEGHGVDEIARWMSEFSRNGLEQRCRGLRALGWSLSRKLAIFIGAVMLMAAALAWLVLQAGDLRLDPASAAQLEARMWRSYYERRWVRLAWDSWRMAREQFGFSPWDALRLGWHASRAAAAFRLDTHAPDCLPELKAYYGIIQRRALGACDPSRAACLELEWWKQRRQNVPAEDYAWTIARLAAEVHGGPEEAFYPASLARARAMAWRDARRRSKMGEAEWREVARQLEEAWSLFCQTLVEQGSVRSPSLR